MKSRFATLLFLLGFSAIFPVAAAELQLTETEDVIRVSLRGKPVLEYVKKEKPVPKGIAPHYRRSGYIHPVYSPQGQEVTGDFPIDHAHQHALFLAWTRCSFDGRNVDFWNQAKQTGRIEHRGVTKLERLDDRVSFVVDHAFVVGTGDRRTDALNESWTLTVHLTPEDHFLFDIESVQECASAKPFKHEKYRYGGMALRGNYEWLKEKDDHSIDPGDLQFLTSEGKNRWEGNHTRPNWVAMTGKLNGQETSLVVMCSPENFRAPQHVRLHPNKPYFCFAPMVEKAFTIEPGKKYVSRYRYLVKSSKADPDLIDKHWQAYAREFQK